MWILAKSSEQTLHCHTVQTNCYNLTSAQNISIFKLMTNVFDVEHHLDVAPISMCACVDTLSPFSVLSYPEPLPNKIVCFHAYSVCIYSGIPMQSTFWGRDCFHCLIFSNAFYFEYTRINACSYCLCTLRLRSAYITQCDCDTNSSSIATAHSNMAMLYVFCTIITTLHTVYPFHSIYIMKYNTKRCKWMNSFWYWILNVMRDWFRFIYVLCLFFSVLLLLLYEIIFFRLFTICFLLL